MIIYGTKSTLLTADPILEACPSCGKPNALQMHVFQQYAHIFWIPFFPIGKTGVSVCTNCKQTLVSKKMDGALKLAYQNLKAQAKAPLWVFTGLGLVALGVAYGFYTERKTNARNAQWITAPVKGDIFELKTKDDHYTLLKVTTVMPDSVYAIYNKYQTDAISGLDDMRAKGDSTFVDNEVYGFAKKQLKKLLDDGTIVNIDR